MLVRNMVCICCMVYIVIYVRNMVCNVMWCVDVAWYVCSVVYNVFLLSIV